MAYDHVTRFSAELFEAAADEGRREHRSARQQLEHWTRLGKELSAHETARRRRILATAHGETPTSELATDGHLVANVALDVAIRERASTTFFGQALLKAGMTAVALDENGVLTQFNPDDESHPLDVSRQTASQAVKTNALRSG